MQALTSYLRKASEHSPTASYYNVDILKYQVQSSTHRHRAHADSKALPF